MTTAAYVLGLLVAGVACWAWLRCVSVSLRDEPTLVQQWKAVWAAPVIRVRVK